MPFKAVTIQDTQIMSISDAPVDAPEGTKLIVYREKNKWGLVDATINRKVVTGEVLSAHYEKLP